MTRRQRRLAAPAGVLAIPVVLALAVVLALVGACVPAPVGRASTPPTQATGPPATASTAPAPTGPTPPPSFIRPTPTPRPTFMSYVVKSGDTLEAIAEAHGTTARSIAFWNRATYPSLDPDSPEYAPDRIRIGWVLQLVPEVEIDEDETFP